MSLPIPIQTAPMEALTASSIPRGPEWQYEPKWDGFRCLAFRDGDRMSMLSKSGQHLERYFPELVSALGALRAKEFVLDGEILILRDHRSDFDALLQRIHPAESRIRRLAAETPATLTVFDILADDRGRDLSKEPLARRRAALEKFAGKYFQSPIQLSPATHDFEEARNWLDHPKGELDGVVAKRVDVPYAAGARDAMVKIKKLRTADCVVGGFRYASKGKVVGSLLLGLYDEQGRLNHVGFTSGIPAAEKRELTKKLESLIEPPGFTGSAPGGPSRWSTRRSDEWKPLKPQLVVEVQFDHVTGHRFRHGTKLLRWRPDKNPKKCTMDQLKR